MNRATKLTLAATLPVAALAFAWQSNSAAAAPVEPPNPDSGVVAPAPADAFPQPTGDVPADWAMLIDDTGSIAIRVPSTWTAIDLAPTENADGSPHPWISATTDESLFFPPDGTADTFSVPGVVYSAYPMEAVTTERLESSVYNDLCIPGPVQSYADGAFVGYIQSFDRCAGTDSRIVKVVANPRVGFATVVLHVQLTGQPDDEATLDGLLSTFTNLSYDDVITSVISDLTTPVEPPSTAGAGGNALGVLEQQLHDQLGLAITDEQAICLANATGHIDPDVLEAAAANLFGMSADVLLALLNCGVDVFGVPAN